MLGRRIRIRYFSEASKFAVPRRQYKCHPRLVEAVLDDLRNGVDPKAISVRVGCPISTIYRWRKRLQECAEFDPLSPRPAPNRIFTQEEESFIAAMIRGEFLTKGLLFTDAEFRALIMDQYLSKYRDVEDAPSFQCSNGFVYDFKRRHGFSSRKGRIARRPPTDQTSIQIWTEQISHLLETCDRDRILNCDETSWTVFPNNILTWADVGAECVPLKVNGDEKNCLTALATVTANGGKLSLFFIAKGLTDRVLDNSVKKSGCFQENWFHKINGRTNPGDLAGRRRVPRRQRLGSCCARASSYQSMKRTFSVIIHKSCQDHAMRIFTISKKHRRVKEGEPDDHAHVSKQVFIDNFVYSSIGPATR